MRGLGQRFSQVRIFVEDEDYNDHGGDDYTDYDDPDSENKKSLERLGAEVFTGIDFYNCDDYAGMMKNKNKNRL